MSVDLSREKLITLLEAAGLLPPRRRGRPVSPITVWRWIRIGHRGVFLEAARLPSGWVTSREALGRFIERLTAQSSGQQLLLPSPDAPANPNRDACLRRLDAEGFSGPRMGQGTDGQEGEMPGGPAAK